MASPDDSPPGLQGASRTTGGFICGRAHGIAYNMGDYNAISSDTPSPPPPPVNPPPPADSTKSVPSQGRVHVFVSRSDPPIMTMPIERVPTLGPVLAKLSRRYSPVRSKYLNIFISTLILTNLLRR